MSYLHTFIIGFLLSVAVPVPPVTVNRGSTRWKRKKPESILNIGSLQFLIPLSLLNPFPILVELIFNNFMFIPKFYTKLDRSYSSVLGRSVYETTVTGSDRTFHHQVGQGATITVRESSSVLCWLLTCDTFLYCPLCLYTRGHTSAVPAVPHPVPQPHQEHLAVCWVQTCQDTKR